MIKIETIKMIEDEKEIYLEKSAETRVGTICTILELTGARYVACECE